MLASTVNYKSHVHVYDTNYTNIYIYTLSRIKLTVSLLYNANFSLTDPLCYAYAYTYTYNRLRGKKNYTDAFSNKSIRALQCTN